MPSVGPPRWGADTSLARVRKRQPLKPDIINLNEVIGDMTELLRRTLGAGIRIEECLAPDLWQSLPTVENWNGRWSTCREFARRDAERWYAHAGNA